MSTAARTSAQKTLRARPAPSARPAVAPGGRERRAAERFSLDLPAKLRPTPGLRFLAARTLDVSRSGALLSVEAPRPLSPGETIEIALAFSPTPLLRSGDLLRATVVRTLPTLPTLDAQPQAAPRQRLAVRFEQALDAKALPPATRIAAA